jgi:tRNA pseudouridine38-40 synthase
LNNYKLIVQYDGTNYAGWQMQQNAVSVQQKLIEAIETITKEKVNLIGSGRTDSGVHALGQVANFRIDKELDIFKFQYSLNSLLPNDISVVKVDKVNESFHARFDAKSRSYLYLFSRNKSPFYNKYSYQFYSIEKFNFEYLNGISKIILGEHDFTSFSKKNVELNDKNCIVSGIHWKKGKELSYFYITANRFLHGMVRTIIGTLLFAANNNLDEKYLSDVFEQKNRKEAEESVPAKGLFLFKVRY